MVTPPAMLLCRRLGIAALFALAACGPTPEAVAPVEPAPPPKASAVAEPAATLLPPEPAAAAKIQADVAHLASDALEGRGTGEPGARMAAEHVAARFEALRLRPLGDPKPDGTRGWLQTFTARVGARAAPPVVARAAGKGGKETPVPDGSAIVADGSASGDVSGEPAFVGFGITANAVGWDDYAGSTLSGKIAVVLSGVPRLGDDRDRALRDFGATRYKIRTAREHGAAAVVIVAEKDELPAASSDASSMGVPAVVVKASAAKTLLSGTNVDLQKARAATAAGKPVVAERTMLRVWTKVDPIDAEAFNVVGALPARETSPTRDEWVVVGAHFDHLGMGGTSASRAPGVRAIHHGADDNASGTALLLDVARRLASRPERPARSIAFVAFGAEEIGAIGSRWFVEHPPFPMQSVAAMINADMVGRMRNSRLLVDGVGTALGWAPLVRDAAEGLGLVLAFGSEGFGASDHASFTAARVPVAFLFTGVHDDYHKPTDTADKIDAAGIEKVATLAARLALGVAERKERLAFVDAPSDPHRGAKRGGGFRSSLGTMPDYAYQGKGMRLSGVRPDAPAARAGLKAGDVIVKIGTHEIGNVHDFMYALGDLEPGREVTVEIERDGARTSVTVIPAPGR